MATGKVAGRDFLLHYTATVGLCIWRWRNWRFRFLVFWFCFAAAVAGKYYAQTGWNRTLSAGRDRQTLTFRSQRLARAQTGRTLGRFCFVFAYSLRGTTFSLVAAKMMIDEVVICPFLSHN